MTKTPFHGQESLVPMAIPELTDEMIAVLGSPFKVGDPFDKLGYLAVKAVPRPKRIYADEAIQIPIEGISVASHLGVSGQADIELAEVNKEEAEYVVGACLSRRVEVAGWMSGTNAKTGKRESFLHISLLD